MNGEDVLKSCGVTFKNQQYIFGGENSESKKRQVLQVEHCGLFKLGAIPSDFRLGACGSNEDAIVLCFSSYHSNESLPMTINDVEKQRRRVDRGVYWNRQRMNIVTRQSPPRQVTEKHYFELALSLNGRADFK